LSALRVSPSKSLTTIQQLLEQPVSQYDLLLHHYRRHRLLTDGNLPRLMVDSSTTNKEEGGAEPTTPTWSGEATYRAQIAKIRGVSV